MLPCQNSISAFLLHPKHAGKLLRVRLVTPKETLLSMYISSNQYIRREIWIKITRIVPWVFGFTRFLFEGRNSTGAGHTLQPHVGDCVFLYTLWRLQSSLVLCFSPRLLIAVSAVRRSGQPKHSQEYNTISPFANLVWAVKQWIGRN